MTRLDEDRTILFGGSGFLGSHILRLYPGIVSVGRTPPPVAVEHIHVDSLADLSALARLEFDRVIYTIGNSDHHTMRAERTPAGDPTPFEYHVVPLHQTLEQLAERRIVKFLHVSTILLYDDGVTPPVAENAAIDPYKDRYALSKHLAEEICRYYAQQLPVVNVRIGPVYGPTRRARHDLIDTLIAQLLVNGSAEVWNTLPERDFLYVEDAARALVELSRSAFTGTVNLGSGTRTSVARVVEILSELSGCVISNLDVPVKGPQRFECDLTRLRDAIDWKPTFTIDEGIERTYEAMRVELAPRR